MAARIDFKCDCACGVVAWCKVEVMVVFVFAWWCRWGWWWRGGVVALWGKVWCAAVMV